MHDESTALIPLRARDGSIRAYAIIDAADAEWVSQWRWHLTNEGYAARGEYVGGGRSQQTVRCFKMHRELLGLTRSDKATVDHINRNRLDNRRCNLRSLDNAVSAQNKASYAGATSPHRGVSLHKPTGKWLARIQVNKKAMHIGLFESEAEAAEAARASRARLMPFAVD